MSKQNETHMIYGVHYDISYDRSIRSWTTLVMDADGNQVGSAQYAPTRDLALIYAGLEAARPTTLDR